MKSYDFKQNKFEKLTPFQLPPLEKKDKGPSLTTVALLTTAGIVVSKILNLVKKY